MGLHLTDDLRWVFPSWRSAPGLFATIALTLALGIALAAAVFSFADGYLFRPLPFPAADQLYRVRDPNAAIASALRASDTAALRQSNLAAFGFVEWRPSSRLHGAILIGDTRVDVLAFEVDPGFRSIVALPLLAGRDFTTNDLASVGSCPHG